MSESIKVDLIGGEGQAELPAALFNVQANVPLMHQVVVAQQAAARQGTHATKTRAMVSGGGAKPWRQKGTGRARQGSRRAPQWTGGGVSHGPQPHGYAQRTPKKMIAAALRGALSDRAREGRVHVVENFGLDKPSTKAALKTLSQVSGARVLVVLARDEDIAWLSLRNVASLHLLSYDQLNAYDVLLSDDVVFSAAALDAFVAGPASGKSLRAAASFVEAVEVIEVQPEAKAVEAEESPYGTGSYVGENPPAGYEIKGNADSMKFHTPTSPWYGRTIAEVWFETEAAAEKAGFVNAVKSDEEAAK